MSFISTTYFGFTAVRESVPSANDWSATYWNWILVDNILNGVLNHEHSGVAALSDPEGDLTLTPETTGGTLPPGKTYYFIATYTDSHGLETYFGAEVSTTTIAGLAAPATPTWNSGTPGDLAAHPGGLTGGQYWYKITYRKGGGETIGSSAVFITVPTDTTYEIKIHFADLDEVANGADAIRVYRKTSTSGTYNYIAEITTTSQDYYLDDNPATLSCDTHPPSENSTNGTNKITVDASSLTNFENANYINIYASETSGTYSSNKCLIGNIDLTDATPGMSIVWTGTSLLTGKPPVTSQTYDSPPKVDLATETSGYVTWDQMPETFSWEQPVATATDLDLVTPEDGEVRMVLDEFTLYAWDSSMATPIWKAITGDILTQQEAIDDVEESATPTAVELKLNELIEALRNAGVIQFS